MREKAEEFILGLVAIFSIIISLLDWFRWLPLPTGTVSSLTLLGIGLVAGYLVLERRNKLDRIEQVVTQGFDKTILSISGGSVEIFKDSRQVYEYAARRMMDAKKSVDDLTWGAIQSTRRTKAEEDAFQKYVEAIVATASRKEIRYREVMTFPSEERIRRAEEILARNIYGYQLRYYDIEHEATPPLLQFMVIDSEEVILASHRGTTLPVEGEPLVATRHPEIVRYFQDYYNAIWQGAKRIKDAGKPPNGEILKKIGQQLTTQA
ncbi:MAG TPA: hypothetical protein ENJ28_04200 [Gammaproteobacteria bacterium]|nr:hypothetical protein [Gammaproteobacteria bacterium]